MQAKRRCLQHQEEREGGRGGVFNSGGWIILDIKIIGVSNL